jgi:phosphoesterase RecJ-like protein
VTNGPQPHITYDLVISLDCGDESRMGKTYATLPEPRPPVINIDHHVTNTRFGAIQLVDPTAVSTTEILYDLFRQLNVPITTDIAASLLTGLVTDTLGFRTVGTTAKRCRSPARWSRPGRIWPKSPNWRSIANRSPPCCFGAKV